MALEYRFTCPLRNGIHARPASAIEEVARPFDAATSLVNERTGQSANAKSVLAIIAIDVRLDDRCTLSISGHDQSNAFAALTSFLENQFPHCDDALPPVEVAAGEAVLPPVLKQANADVIVGTPVVPGIGEGRAVMLGAFELPASIPRSGATNLDAEVARLDAAIDTLGARYELQMEHAAGVEAAVLRAHRSITRDPEFRGRLHLAIRKAGATAAGAIVEAERHFGTMLIATGSALLRERALDIRDVCLHLLQEVYGDAARAEDVRLVVDSVCIADSLTPGQFLALDRRFLKGLVLAHGGTTSHTVILARSFGIPTLVGVTDVVLAEGAVASSPQLSRDAVIVDAHLGILVRCVTPAVQRYYHLERRRLDARRHRLRDCIERPAVTADGRRLQVGANIGTADEAASAFASGAEGIGLFRTEMLFVDRSEPPSEEEQFEQYRRVLAEADERPVIIRTLDVGGDKPIPYLRLPKEDNPFLGYRAVRLYPEFDALFRSQIAALVRASAFGRLQVMVPMISRPEEARWVRQVVAEEQAKHGQADIAFDASMQVGAMVEVPSLAFALDHASRDLDFFSIGTNDLLQYFVAVDRANAKVAALYDAATPAFLRLLKKIVDEAHAHERWVGLCGEMGGQLQYLPLLVGLGLDEISMASPSVAAAKAQLRPLSAADCTRLLETALTCATADEVHELLRRFESASPAPLIEPDLVMFDADVRTKEEAIKVAVDQLYVTGRTDRPRQLEDAVWQREIKYSTGFGHGFAIPHAKTDAVKAHSLVVLTLKTPVEWQSLDEKPVSFVLLLAVPESERAAAHMKVLQVLARKVMHEDFRDRLAGERDAAALVAFLGETIGV